MLHAQAAVEARKAAAARAEAAARLTAGAGIPGHQAGRQVVRVFALIFSSTQFYLSPGFLHPSRVLVFLLYGFLIHELGVYDCVAWLACFQDEDQNLFKISEI